MKSRKTAKAKEPVELVKITSKLAPFEVAQLQNFATKILALEKDHTPKAGVQILIWYFMAHFDQVLKQFKADIRYADAEGILRTDYVTALANRFPIPSLPKVKRVRKSRRGQ